MPRTLLGAGSLILLLFLATPGEALARAAGDSVPSFQFGLVVDGAPFGFFLSVEGIGSESEVESFSAIGDPIIRKIPGRLHYSDITLKRGLTSDRAISDWRTQVESGDIAGARKAISILLYDSAGTAVARWNFTNAWPSKVSIVSDPEADLVLESVVLTVEQMLRVDP